MIYIVKKLYCSKSDRFKKQMRTVRSRIPLPFLIPVNTTTKTAKATPPSLRLSLGQTSYSPERRVSKAAEAGA